MNLRADLVWGKSVRELWLRGGITVQVVNGSGDGPESFVAQRRHVRRKHGKAS